MWSKMALVLVLMLAFYGVHSASLPTLLNPSNSSEGRLDALTGPSDVSDGVLDTSAARLDTSGTIDALSTQETSDRQSDFSSSEDAQSDELRTPSEASEMTNPLHTLTSKIESLPNPLDVLDGVIGTLASEKVRRSVIEDVKQLIENKFSALLEDGVKRIAGKKGILQKGLKVKPTSRSSLVLKVKERDPDSTIEERESQNSGMIKVLTDGSLQDSGDVELRNVVDELLREDEDRTIEKDILDSNEDHLNIENLVKSHNDATTIKDYDDISESSKNSGHIVEKNLSDTSDNDDKTEVLEKILDLDEILKSALKDLSDSLSQENVNDDNDEDHNLTTKLDAKNDKSDEKLSEMEYQPQKNNELEEHVEDILRNGIDHVENGDDGTQAYKASNIEIDENVLQTERSTSSHRGQKEDDELHPEKILRHDQNLSNLILFDKNKTTSELRNSNDYASSESSHPRQSDKPIDAYQSLNIKENYKIGNLKHDHEQDNFNKISEDNKYADQVESIAQPENKSDVKAYSDENQYLKGESKHLQQQTIQEQTKKHHHHHHHYHHHHLHKNKNINKLTINKSKSDDLSILNTNATQEKIYLGEPKNDNTAEKPNHPKQETEEEDNVTEESKKGFEEKNNLTDEKDNVTKERKSILEEIKNNHEEDKVTKRKTGDNGYVLENKTIETRTAAKHVQTIRGQSSEINEEGNNSKELIDETDNSRSGKGEIIYITDDKEKLTEKGRKDTEKKEKFEEEDLNVTEDDVTAEVRSGCHNENHHKRKGKAHENDETNVLQDLMYNKDKIKSYTLSMTFTTRK